MTDEVRAEATQVKLPAPARTYGWAIAICEINIRLVVLDGQLVTQVTERDPYWRFHHDARVPRTTWEVEPLLQQMGCSYNNVVITTQHFSVPRAVYSRIADTDDTIQNNGISELFAHFGLNLMDGLA